MLVVSYPGEEATVAGPVLLDSLQVGISWHLWTEFETLGSRLLGVRRRSTAQRGQTTWSGAPSEPHTAVAAGSLAVLGPQDWRPRNQG